MTTYLLITAVVIFACVFLSKVSSRLGIPMLLAFIHNLTNSFVNIFYVNIVILIIAFIISVTVSREYIAEKEESIDED